ncbi:LOW QUALITY PROTEIN: putative sugar binding secreted protein [Geomicrobium sp. JCM 19037]|nr:LOW QUALITY PROTEIN: putative sugar binding secreted protein [Geomicrobium sp. JCM 19037]
MKWRNGYVVVGSVLLLTACNGDEGSSADGEDVSLTMWTFDTVPYEEMAAEYMEEHPHITIQVENLDMEDHHNNLFNALSASSGAPDMAMIEVSEMDRFQVAEDRFHNLYEYGAEDVTSDYLDWAWAVSENTDGDFLFGLPTDIGPTVMFYRQDVFEEAGLPSEPEEVEEMIATWEDYEETARTIYEETGKPMVDNPELIFNAQRDIRPEAYFNEEDELIMETSTHVREAYDYTVDMIDEGTVGSVDMWSPEWGDAQAQGSYATMLAPAWMQGSGTMLPILMSGASRCQEMKAGNWGGSYMTVPAESEHPEEAYEFLAWMLSPDQQLEAFRADGLFPSTPATYEMEEFQNYSDEYFGGQNTAQIFAEAAEDVSYIYKGRHYGMANEEVLEALMNVVDGSDAEQEWQAAVNRIDQQMNR